MPTKPSEAKLREAAQAIRPHLKELVGSPEASQLDSRLLELLKQGDQGAEVGAEIQRLLAERDGTRVWLQAFLEKGTVSPAARSYQGLPGDSTAKPGKKFVCPDGDFEWYLPFKGFPMPKCPVHRKDLVKAP